MKKGIFSLLLVAFFAIGLSAQEKPVKFTVTVSTDSVLLGNYFELKFTLENAGGESFQAPDFSEHFNVVSGPNTSTSMSIMNGDVTQSMTMTYYLEPKNVGTWFILPASVEAEGKILETKPVEVLVVPNPDGIKQELPRQNQSMQFNWGGDPFDGFDFSFPEIKEMPAPPPPQEEAPVKKKKKTIRI